MNNIFKYSEHINESGINDILNIASDEGFHTVKKSLNEIVPDFTQVVTYRYDINPNDGNYYLSVRSSDIVDADEILNDFKNHRDNYLKYIDICNDIRRRLLSDDEYHCIVYYINTQSIIRSEVFTEELVLGDDLPLQVDFYKIPFVASITNRNRDTIVFIYDGNDIMMYGGSYYRMSSDVGGGYSFIDPSGGPYINKGVDISYFDGRLPSKKINRITGANGCFRLEI